MHIDAREIENNTVIEGDLCIVGAGAAGISLAMQWINADKKVILLEGGGLEYEAVMQDLYRGKNVGLPYFPLDASRLHLFGGTTGNWAGFCSTLDPIDFRQRSWVPESGWPFESRELERFYPAAHEILDLPAYNSTSSIVDPEAQVKPLIPSNDTIWNKIWFLSPPTRFGKKYREPLLKAQNIHLYTHANVTEIRMDPGTSKVTELQVKELSGKKHVVRAKTFVLACCALQNARLLLASNKRMSAGLGNAHDLVGRYFMEHIQSNAADLFLPQAQSLDYYRLQLFHTKRRAELSLNGNKQSQLQILNTTAALNPKEESIGWEERKSRAEDGPDAILKKWQNDEERFRRGEIPKQKFKPYKHYLLFVRTEQAPNYLSRVMLDKEQDELGVPRIALDWRLTELEKTSFRKFCDVIGKQVGVMNIGRVKLHDWLLDPDNNSWSSSMSGAFNHMGTTKMHSDPKKGVVDENCKVHQVDNLYIAGSSCFPTAGIANPMLPLVALTLRLSDHLKAVV